MVASLIRAWPCVGARPAQAFRRWSPQSQPAQERRWYPTGYFVYPQNPNIAGRWDHSPHCDYGASCMGLYKFTRYGCPNLLYAELNILSRGVVVSYTNDSLGSIRPRQIARLTFNVYDLPAGARGQLSKVDCY
jgi:hypothetical protein